MTLRNLTRVVSFGVVLPFVVLVVCAIGGLINFHGGDWMLLVVLCMLSVTVASVVTAVAGLRLRARTHDGERGRVMLLLLVGGAPILWIVGSLVYERARWSLV